MRLFRWFFLSILVGFFASCTHNTSTAGGGNHPRNTGPFDRNGNYVESWVSQPSRWGGTATPVDLAPTIVKRNDEDARDRRRAPQVVSNKSTRGSSASSRSTSRSSSSATAKRSTRDDDDDKPAKRSSTSSRSATAKNTSTKSGSTKSSSTKPKSSSSSKTASSRYTVKKGDSLAAIAKRNGTTVSKLKAANGISGSTIRPGQALKVPK